MSPRPLPLYAAFALVLVSACTSPKTSEVGAFEVVDSRIGEPVETPRIEQAIVSPQSARRAAVRGFIRRPAAPVFFGTAPLPNNSADRGDEITLDFSGSDLASVIDVLMRDGLGLTYILDPDVRGTVTLRTSRPLSTAEILPTLEEILRLNDAALIERDGVFTIVPRAEAGLSPPLATFGDVTARGLTTRVTPLRHVSVDDIAEVLEGFAPIAGSIGYDRAHDLVFTIGSIAEQKTLLDLIRILDVDQFAGRAFALQPLQEAAPAQVADELQLLFASEAGEANPDIRILPIERMNAVLIITDNETLFDQSLDLLRRLDQSIGDSPRITVFPINNRRASDLAELLANVFGVSNGGGSTSIAVAPGLVPRRDVLEATAGSTEDPITMEQEGRIDPFAGSISDTGVLRLYADESSNSIVALATSAGAEALGAAIRRLDVQPLQVLLEATLVEVELNDRLEYGVRWFLQSGNFNFSFGDIVGDTINSGAGNIFPGFNAAFRTTDIQVTLSALDEVTDVRILSSPTLMVLDNQTARLQVGDQVPITTRSSVSTEDPNAPIVAESDFRDTGVILEVSPTVNAGGLVVLKIRQEISTVVDTSDAINPTFSQRVVDSVIAVDSGETIALAGLIEENQARGRDGIPILSEIPIAGALFGTRADAVGRSELLVLIRPVVVRDQRDARAATLELRRRLVNLDADRTNPRLNNALTPLP